MSDQGDQNNLACWGRILPRVLVRSGGTTLPQRVAAIDGAMIQFQVGSTASLREIRKRHAFERSDLFPAGRCAFSVTPHARPVRRAHSRRIGDGSVLGASTWLAMSQDADASASRRNRITRPETSSFDQIA